MRALLIRYKSVLQFILTFLFVYFFMAFSYNLYLYYSVGTAYYPDYITNIVSRQIQELLIFSGYETQVLPHPDERSMKLIVNGKYLARVIEGCNSVSVIILFISFVIAFSGRIKTTFFFVLSGSVLIYIVNLIRIVILSIALYHYPWRSEILHSVVFPAIIYGVVFLLWMLWVNWFSNIGRRNG